MRRLGVGGLDLCFVAAGRVDAYFEAGCDEWDYAAGALIATEAGCVVTGLRGRPPGPRFLAGVRRRRLATARLDRPCWRRRRRRRAAD